MFPFPGHTEAFAGPWERFRSELVAAGATVADGGPIGAVIVLNHSNEALRWCRRNNIGISRRTLVLMEPQSTHPAAFTEKVLSQYGHVFAASRIWATEIGARPFDWPQTLGPCPPVPEGPFDFDATMILADKRSGDRGSNYWLRRGILKAAPAFDLEIGVAGPGWDDGVRLRLQHGIVAVWRSVKARRGLPSYRNAFGGLLYRPPNRMGVVPRKSDALRRARVSIVIENSQDYVSEKLVDSIVAGVAPVYIGPSLHGFGIPSSVAIQAKADPVAALEAVAALRDRPQDAAEIVRQGRLWLSDPSTRQLQAENVLGRLARDIAQALKE